MSPGSRQPQTTRRRVSKSTYWVRRLLALVVVSAMLFGGYAAVGALMGDDANAVTQDNLVGSSTLATVSSTTASSTTGSSVAGSESAETTAAVTTSALPVADVSRVPTAADPAKLLIAGDSDAGTFGPYLETLMAKTGLVTTTLDYKVSSGLARPDFYDWPSHFQSTIPSRLPDIVIVTFGGNDSQGLTDLAGTFIVDQPNGNGDAAWRTEYGNRVGGVMDYLSADGRTLIWVGIPNDNNPDVTLKLAIQNDVVKAEAAKRPNVIFVDTWSRFSGRDGNWAEYVIDPRDGQGKDVRADDGFHLNTNGAEILALDIATVLRNELIARGAAL